MKTIKVVTHGWNCKDAGMYEVQLDEDSFAKLITGYVLEGYVVQSYTQNGMRVITATCTGDNVVISVKI